MLASKVEVLFRLIALTAVGYFVYGAWNAWEYQHSLAYPLIVVGEAITFFYILVARPAKQFDSSYLSILFASFASAFLVLFSFRLGTEVVPRSITNYIQVAAVLFQIVAKISLGRSFGILPANRGVVSMWAYKIVRHPIYLGYLCNYLAYILGSFTLWNAVLWVLVVLLQIARITREEKLLAMDPEYVLYQQSVRFRLVPGVF